MKRVIVLCLMILPLVSFGQKTMTDFLEENCDVVWFGLDFTKAKMIGEEGFSDPVAIKEDYFRKWNHLMISEGDKYDWGKALLISDLKYDYDVVDVVNDEVNVQSLVINRSHSIYDEDIESAVRNYTIKHFKEGIGVVIVVESFDKTKEQAFGYITFFDIASKKVLYKQRLIGSASGIGFRNFWAGAIHDWTKYTRGRVMRDIKKEFR